MTSRMDAYQPPEGMKSANDAGELVDWISVNLDPRFCLFEVHRILDDSQVFFRKMWFDQNEIS